MNLQDKLKWLRPASSANVVVFACLLMSECNVREVQSKNMLFISSSIHTVKFEKHTTECIP